MATKALTYVNRDLGHATTIPITGTYLRGDRLWNRVPWPGHPIGWVCIIAGSPGTWKPFGDIGGSASSLWTPAMLTSLQLWYPAWALELADAASVTTWPDLSRNGFDVTQATAANKPTFQNDSTVLSAVQPSVDFDGSNDILTSTANINALRTDTTGVMLAVAKSTSATAGEAVISFSRTAQNFYLEGEARNASDHMQVGQRAGDTADTVEGSTAVGSSWHLLMWGSNDTAFVLEVDGAGQTESATSGSNNGDWMSTVTSMDRVSLGARFDNTSVKNLLTGSIAEVLYMNSFTEWTTERSNILAYINRIYGSAFS